MKKLLSLLFLFLSIVGAASATLLPPGEQQFLGVDGTPLAGGYVYFYVPGTTTPKTTWQNSTQTIQNANPVPLNQGGFATIYGSGSYREIVQDSAGNTIYDNITADTSVNGVSWAGTAGGTANSITLSASAFSAQDGQAVSFVAQSTNTGPASVVIGGNTYSITKPGVSGPVPLIGGEILIGAEVNLVYIAATGTFQLTNESGGGGAGNSPFVTVASGSTTDLGATGSNNVVIGGTTTITSFGSTASTFSPYYVVTFLAKLTLTENATSLITPNGQNIYTQPNTTLTLQYLGSGNWKILSVASAVVPGLSSINVQTGTTYTLLQSDQASTLLFTNTGAQVLTLPQAVAPFANGFYFDLENTGGILTVSPTTSTISGSSSWPFGSNTSGRIISVNGNWVVLNYTSLNTATLLNTISASSSANLIDTSSFGTGFNHYKIQFNNISPATNATTCAIQVLVSGVLETTGYVAVDQGVHTGGAFTESETTYIPCSPASEAATTSPAINGTCQVDNPSQSANVVPFSCTFTSSSPSGGGIVRFSVGGWFATVGALSGFEISMGSGNIASGTLQVSGWN
jgi:hypothetical protein